MLLSSAALQLPVMIVSNEAGEELLFELEGIPVSEYVYRMFTDSDNVRAELLFLNLGYSLCGKANYDNGKCRL